MDSPPPLFVPQPQTGSKPPQPGPWKWVVVAVVAVVALVGVLVAITVPVYQSVQRKAHETRVKRLDAVKPKLPLAAEEKAAVEAFGRKVAQAVTEGDAAFLTGATDVEAMLDRVLLPLGEEGFDAKGFRKGFVNGLKHNEAGLFVSVIGSKATYLRQGERDGFPTVRLRVTFEGGAASFFELLVTVDQKLNCKVVDFFTFVYGSYSSTDVRNAMLGSLSKEQANPVRAMLGMKDYDSRKLEALTKMGAALRLGRTEQIIAEYDKLPEGWKDERTFFLIYLQALTGAQSESPETEKRYREALAKAPQLLGKDAATDFLRVDLQFMDNDFAGAEESLRKTEAVVGRDAYLTHMRALMMLRQNKVDEAQRLEQEATKMEPELTSLVDLRMLIHAARKDYAGLVGELRDYRAKHHTVITREHLMGPEYEAFLKSPEFAKWEAENR